MTEVNRALCEWSGFLLGEKRHPGSHEQHMLLVNVLEDMPTAEAPPNMSRYLARAIDPYVAHNQQSAITYAKMGRFMLFGFVAMKDPERWKGTKLRVRPRTVWRT